MIYLTNETNGHVHIISDVKSGYTDPAEDGHRHRLNIPSCSSCARARRKLLSAAQKLVNRQLHPTDWVKGHLHYYNAEILDEVIEK
jgi:hypothetical protein